MSWSYFHSLIGTRLEESLLFMQTVSALAEVQNLNFWRKFKSTSLIFEDTVNCFSADFEE